MRTRAIVIAITLVAFGALGTVGDAQKKKPARRDPVETGMLGVKLLDSHTDVLRKWGSPTRIVPVKMTDPSQEAAGGGGNPFGGGPPGMPMGAGGGGVAPPVGMRGGGGAPGGPGVAGGGGAGGAGGDQIEDMTTSFTRWEYVRGAVNFAFLIDDQNKVIQIDTFGLTGPGRTSTGIRLGSTFADVMRVYRNPDEYVFKNGVMQVKFLANSHVAFQFRQINGVQRVVFMTVAIGK
jgi:hypothetical protein